MKVFAGWIVIGLLAKIEVQAGTIRLCFGQLVPKVYRVYVFSCA